MMNCNISKHLMNFPTPQMVKNLLAMQETQVRSLDQEDSLEKEMAPHSSILAWRIPWTEEPGGLQSMGSQRVRHDKVTNKHTHTTPFSCHFSWFLVEHTNTCLEVGLLCSYGSHQKKFAST